MQFTAAQIAQLLNGTLEGNADITVTRLSKIEEGGAGSLSFLANPAYTPYIYTTTASLVIVNKDFVPTAPIAATLLRVESAEKAFAKGEEAVQLRAAGAVDHLDVPRRARRRGGDVIDNAVAVEIAPTGRHAG